MNLPSTLRRQLNSPWTYQALQGGSETVYEPTKHSKEVVKQSTQEAVKQTTTYLALQTPRGSCCRLCTRPGQDTGDWERGVSHGPGPDREGRGDGD